MISVVIIAKNAASTIDACLDSVKKANEVIVVLDSSTSDNTEKQIGNRATIYKRSFDNFAAQKNFGISKTTNDWVLSLDADEVMQKGWFEVLKIDDRYAGYLMPRQNIIFGHTMHFTDWGPWDDAHVWLFNKNKARFVGEVHEEVVVDGKVGKLNLGKMHNNYQTVEQFLDKMNQYTSLEAKSKHPGWWYPGWKFIRHYFVHLGFLDGLTGLYLSYLMAIYGLCICVKSRLD